MGKARSRKLSRAPAAASPAGPIASSEPASPRRRALVYSLVSILLLVPCFWQSRLQAGDLSSHIYNAWLAKLIEYGRMPGLTIASQTTNVLFDLMLSGLYSLLGPEAAQRIAVSIAVLVFVWGAFAFVSKVAGRRPWHLLICIAMLAYGWVFHMGFFNFYLSLGLCFWVLALAWDPIPLRLGLCLPLLAAAYLAHALPVGWTACLLLYLWLTRNLAPRWRFLVTGGSLAAMLLVHWIVASNVITRWKPYQIVSSTGLDQVWVFDPKYHLVVMALLLIWGGLLVGLLRRSGVRQVASTPIFHICVISAMGVFVMPGTVMIPGFRHALVYIAERMSLGVGICVLALLGTAARPRALGRYAPLAAALIFFAFLFHDERALNSFEDGMQDAVARLEPGQRVVGGVEDPSLHTFAVTHMIDRVCLGRCFSYGNYEPSTAQFRVRATAANPYVAFRYDDSVAIQRGLYIPQPADLPLYKLDLENGRFVIRAVPAGRPCGMKYWNTLVFPPPAG